MPATHEGLFRLHDQELTRTGTVTDLMGFTITPGGSYPASVHLGPGVDLPEPVGLVGSTDGATWSPLDTPRLMSLVAWVDEATTVGTGIDGRLLTSTDAGKTAEQLL